MRYKHDLYNDNMCSLAWCAQLLTPRQITYMVHTHLLLYLQTSFGVCLGNGDGTFRAGSLYSSASLLTSLVVLDVNSDGIQVTAKLIMPRSVRNTLCLLRLHEQR